LPITAVGRSPRRNLGAAPENGAADVKEPGGDQVTTGLAFDDCGQT
jgi:hypothetical protein